MHLLDHDRMPRVVALMTPFPHFVEPDDRVTRAIELMDRHGIRHVPVKQAGQVVGIVSERDLHRMRNPALAVADPGSLRVRDVQVTDPYTVDLEAPLDVVLGEMAARRIGAAVVVRAGKLAGIVTLTDACQALADELRARFRSPGPDEAA